MVEKDGEKLGKEVKKTQIWITSFYVFALKRRMKKGENLNEGKTISNLEA